MNIVLLEALNYCAYDDRYVPSLPLGILSCAAVLEKQGIPVHVIDPNLLVREAGDDLYDHIASQVLRQNPAIVGFSTYSTTYHQSLRIARRVKELDGRVTTVFGGPQASVVDRETLSYFPWVDLVIRGEGEMTLASVAGHLAGGLSLEGIQGLTFRRGEQIVRAPDAPLIENLDELPMPAYHLYPGPMSSIFLLDVGRGCPFNCTFCSTCGFWKRRFRLKSVSRIIAEIRELKEHYGAAFFEIPHDLFTLDRKKVVEFCDALEREKPGLSWSCLSRIDCMDRELLARMVSCGCTSINYGIETGSPAMQKAIGKNLDLSAIRDIVSMSVDMGLHVITSFIMGFPEETGEDLKQTVDLMTWCFEKGKKAIAVGCSLLIPYAGSELYTRFRDQLVFNDYGPVAARRGSPYDDENISLIRQYPDIFPDYCHFPMKHLERRRLETLVEFVVLPMTVAPATFLVILQEKKDFLSLFSEWEAYNELLDEEKRYRFDPLRGDSHCFFAAHFSGFVRALFSRGVFHAEYLAGLADYETTLYHARYPAAAVQACDPAMIGLCWDDRLFGMMPVRREKIEDRWYEYNVQQLQSQILSGSFPEKVEAGHYRYLLWQSYPGVVDSLQVEALHLRILDLCRGIMTAGELIQALRCEGAGKVEEDYMAGILREWFVRGLVTLEFPGGESLSPQLVQETVERQEDGYDDEADDAPGEENQQGLQDGGQ